MTYLPYRYYVTYTALSTLSQRDFIRGGIDVSRARPITDFDEVQRLVDLIIGEHPELRSVVISGWQRYEAVPE